MTKKELLLQFLEKSEKRGYDYFSLLIETEGSDGYEIIANPMCNYETKVDYINKAYDDDLVLKSYNGIRIVNYDACNGGCNLGSLYIDERNE